MPENKILKSALWYRNKKNLSIIPILPPHKDEKGKDNCKMPEKDFEWKKYQSEKPSPEQVSEWFQNPASRIAIVAGKINNLCVIDCDSEEAKRIVEEHLPDSTLNPTPIATSPRGGYHYYFQATDLPGKPNAMQNLDIRSEGNYIIAPPSAGLNGTGYSWQDGCGLHEVEPMAIPNSLYLLLREELNKSFIYIRGEKNKSQNITDITGSHRFYVEGRRDEDLFTVANALIKTGIAENFTRQTLEIIVQNLGENLEPNKVQEKINSAIKRVQNLEVNIMEEVRQWVKSQEGHFKVTECHTESQYITKAQKHACLMSILRLVKEGVLEKHGNQRGVYRKVENELEEIKPFQSTGSELPIKWIANFQTYIKTMPKTIYVIAGEPDAGKSAICLNMALMNCDKIPISYFSSEMVGEELGSRLVLSEDCDEKKINERIKFYDRSSNFSDVINPNAFNIIDYLEVSKDFWEVADQLKDIRNKLNKGIALIAIQKKRGSVLGRSAEFGLEKPRLYMTVEPYSPDGRHVDGNIIKVVKAKNWRDPLINPNYLTLKFKLVKGINIYPKGGWDYEYEDDAKYSKFKKGTQK
uniref:Putative bifunctional DNA primase/polymerase n=1 Tax=viral metagenome TaxID=1070528 RepID=A0A6H1ZVR0_9ZZZZ